MKHLVTVAQFARDNGMSLVETVRYLGDNVEELDAELAAAYELTYEELLQFVETQTA
jgi:hypothetical protein